MASFIEIRKKGSSTFLFVVTEEIQHIEQTSTGCTVHLKNAEKIETSDTIVTIKNQLVAVGWKFP